MFCYDDAIKIFLNIEAFYTNYTSHTQRQI